MASISSLGDLVGRILDGVDGETLRVGFREEIQRGSASGSISVIEDREEEGSLLLRVALTVMKVPRDVEREFYHRLLQLNGTFQGRAAFSVDEDRVVWLTAGRPIEDLDPSEIIDLILWTSEQADYFDDVLLEEFGYEHRL